MVQDRTLTVFDVLVSLYLIVHHNVFKHAILRVCLYTFHSC